MSFLSLPQLSDEEVEDRKKAFNTWLVKNCGDYYLLPANKQAIVRGLMYRAYAAGYNFRRRTAEAVICVGGD